ncbi:ABC transporter substrate-binding protein [Asticcacaulis sp. BYS171W]|uniref:ABC transporter substrate-binding protein n=1 Tax=Asticcacaulis aquaticus TaxID=2984212 RepID=A0ABT5HRM6_9CAUL|nr:ABC transporter substrate-binding protein [Asticcacaulis aquaticus]MDC7682726.1 ABC transporter substrate-binding protein [Asticcacaulis aquaticus]
MDAYRLHRRTMLLGAAAALTACGRTPSRPAGTKELRMSWWGGSSAHKATLEALSRFEKRHGIRVRAEYTGFAGHLERLTTQISGRTAPDVMQINWFWQTLFSPEGTGFLDLNQHRDKIDLSQFDARSLNMGTTKGHLNAIPVSNAARLVYLNKTTYDKAGLSLPSSWDELFARGPQFKEKLGDGYYPIDGLFLEFIGLARTYVVQGTGKPLISAETKSLNCSRQDMHDFAGLYARMTRDHVWPSAQVRASYGNVAQQEMRPWINGQFAGTFMWNSTIEKYSDTLAGNQKIALAPYPLREGAKDSGMMFRPSMMFAANATTAHPDEAVMLIDFLLNDPDGVRAMELKRGVPVSKTARKLLSDEGLISPLQQASEAQLASAQINVLESPYFEHPRVRDGFQDILEALGYGRISEQQAGDRLFDDINAILHRVVR